MLTHDVELSVEYGHVVIFSEGLATVHQGRESWHIRKDGTPAYKQRFDDVGPFSGGLAQAKKNGKWFHIHRDGTRAYQKRFDEIGFFRSNGRAFAVNHGIQIQITRKGKRV